MDYSWSNGETMDTEQDGYSNIDNQSNNQADAPYFLTINQNNSVESQEFISLPDAHLPLVSGTQTALEKLSETISQIARFQVDIPETAIPSLAFSDDTLKACLKTTDVFLAISDVLKPALDSLFRLIESIDWEHIPRMRDGYWEELQDGAKVWGEYGWTISDLSPDEIKNPPSSLSKANSYYSQYLTRERVQNLFNEILAEISRKNDFRESVALYEQKHYKSCAMMLCSLIEGQLIKRVSKATRRRNGFSALEKISDLDNNLKNVIWVQNTMSAYAYFFRSGDNFNREVEGELNRNFLMHGMMYKPVHKRTCIKLFLLLKSIVVVLPDAASY